MKILLISDLHLECHGDSKTRLIRSLAPADILILAGDIAPVDRKWFEEVIAECCYNYSYVIQVLGNHCYWYTTPTLVHTRLGYLQQKYSNYYVLEKDIITINNITFAGATTWFPDTPDSRLFQKYMNDFEKIKNFVPWVYEENQKAIEFWESVEADIWISHHLPSYQSVSTEWKGDKLNCYFVEPRLGNLIAEKEPKYHLHGHSHDSSDYLINQTRVISNPYGYESSTGTGLNPKFKTDFIINL